MFASMLEDYCRTEFYSAVGLSVFPSTSSFFGTSSLVDYLGETSLWYGMSRLYEYFRRHLGVMIGGCAIHHILLEEYLT
jgi:hypothetical protein